jgi:hypothetical protein
LPREELGLGEADKLAIMERTALSLWFGAGGGGAAGEL